MSLPPPPSVSAVAAGAAPSAAGAPGGAGRGVAPGAGLRSSAGRRRAVWACSDARGNRDCHVCQLKPRWLAKHGTRGQFLCSIEAPFLRPDLGLARAPRAAAVKTGRSAAQATAEGAREAVLTAVSTAPDWARLRHDHAACRSASF